MSIINNKLIINAVKILTILLSIPVLAIIIKILFAYGNLFGTIARYIIEGYLYI